MTFVEIFHLFLARCCLALMREFIASRNCAKFQKGFFAYFETAFDVSKEKNTEKQGSKRKKKGKARVK